MNENSISNMTRWSTLPKKSAEVTTPRRSFLAPGAPEAKGEGGPASRSLGEGGWEQIWDRIWAQQGFVQRGIDLVRKTMHTLHRHVLLRHLRPSSRLLELGCGPASLTLALAPQLEQLVGIDISDEALRQARTAQAAAGITNAQFLKADCRAVPFTDQFDVVWSAGLIEHFFDHDLEMVREHLKATKPGGVALMSVPAKYSLHHLQYHISRPRMLRWLWPWSDERHFQKFYRLSELRVLGRKTGQTFRVYYLPPPLLGFFLGIAILEIRKR